MIRLLIDQTEGKQGGTDRINTYLGGSLRLPTLVTYENLRGQALSKGAAGCF
jgi:hypothetical protein